MLPFPKDIEVPKYEKYDGNRDLHDHVRQFYALSMDFMHDDTSYYIFKWSSYVMVCKNHTPTYVFW